MRTKEKLQEKHQIMIKKEPQQQQKQVDKPKKKRIYHKANRQTRMRTRKKNRNYVIFELGTIRIP